MAMVILGLGCGHVVLLPPQPELETVLRLRTGRYQPIHLGNLNLGPEFTEKEDRRVAIRGGIGEASAISSAYSRILMDTLGQNLQAAGLVDPVSPYGLEGTLMALEIHGGIKKAECALTVHWVLRRAGAVLYDRQLTVTETWGGRFGAQQIPMAVGHELEIFQIMAATLLDDREFMSVLSQVGA